jgi:hypothetical protein
VANRQVPENLQVYREMRRDVVRVGCLYILWTYIIAPILGFILFALIIAAPVIYSMTKAHAATPNWKEYEPGIFLDVKDQKFDGNLIEISIKDKRFDHVLVDRIIINCVDHTYGYLYSVSNNTYEHKSNIRWYDFSTSEYKGILWLECGNY